MVRLEDSGSILQWGEGWSVGVSILTFVSSLGFASTLKFFKEYEWTVIVSASVALTIATLSVIVGILIVWANQRITTTYVAEYTEKHGTPLYLPLQADDLTCAFCDNTLSVSTGITWIIGCVWSLALISANRNNIVHYWWFAVIAHLGNFAVAIGFSVLVYCTGDCAKVIDRGTKPPIVTVTAPTRSTSPLDEADDGGMELQPLTQEPRRAAQGERVDGQADDEEEAMDNTTVAVVEPRRLSRTP